MRRSLQTVVALACSSFFACKSSTKTHSPPESTAQIRTNEPAIELPDASSGDADTPAGDADAPAFTSAQKLTIATREWTFPSGRRAVVLVPDTRGPLPLVIALHGRGEALKGKDRGAWGWPRDYDLLHALDRVQAPPLTNRDFLGFVTDPHLAKRNRELADHRYGPVVVACPYLPDVKLEGTTELDAYASFVVDELLPRLKKETSIDESRIGIDGVSLGGAVALYVGFKYAREFSRVGAIQGAIQQADTPTWLERAVRARSMQPALSVRILTSDEDYFRDGNRSLAKALEGAAFKSEFIELPGPHDYPFNRGPGSYELLFFHAR